MPTSRFWRTYWASLGFALGFDLALGWLIAYFADREDMWLTGVGIFFGIQAVGILIMIKGLACSWIWFSWKGREASADDIARNLIDNHFPKPEYAVHNGEQYLFHLIDDEDRDIDLRLKAAAQLGALTARKGLGFTSALQATAIMDRAVDIVRAHRA